MVLEELRKELTQVMNYDFIVSSMLIQALQNNDKTDIVLPVTELNEIKGKYSLSIKELENGDIQVSFKNKGE
jgi:hypothetical protein